MLRAGFLRQVSDWVSQHFDQNQNEVARALKEFKVETLLSRNAEPETIMGLFSEWLVFDRVSDAFKGLTGIEYFVKYNPLKLSQVDIEAYSDLLKFHVGLFSVVEIKPGELVGLKDMQGNVYRAHDVNTSLSLMPNQTIWARVADVRGVNQMISSIAFVVPITLGNGVHKKIVRECGEVIDARVAGELFCESNKKQGNDGNGFASMQKHIASRSPVPEFEAGEALDKLLAKCGMSKMYSSATLKMWVNNQSLFPPDFPFRALFFLMPDTLSKKERGYILDATETYLNNCPRSSLQGKSSLEKAVTMNPRDRVLMNTDYYDYDEYRTQYERASALLAQGDYVGSYDAYKSLIQQLLSERVPAFVAFRLYANAALACFMQPGGQKYALGVELVKASLRLNPQYDFGLKQREQYVDPYPDLSVVPKNHRKLFELQIKVNERDAIRKYNRSAFGKYEMFLQKCGVSLSFATISKITVYKIPTNSDEKNVSIGRNDPCYCGSGKKLKKCHGV